MYKLKFRQGNDIQDDLEYGSIKLSKKLNNGNIKLETPQREFIPSKESPIN